MLRMYSVLHVCIRCILALLCPDVGWIGPSAAGKCYYAFPDLSLTPFEAMIMCQDIGAQLPKGNTNGELQFISQM